MTNRSGRPDQTTNSVVVVGTGQGVQPIGENGPYRSHNPHVLRRRTVLLAVILRRKPLEVTTEHNRTIANTPPVVIRLTWERVFFRTPLRYIGFDWQILALFKRSLCSD